MPFPRHRCRELLFQTLFAWEFRDRLFTPEEFLQSLRENMTQIPDREEDLPDFLLALAKGVLERLNDIKRIIQEFAPEWPLDKINPIDRAVMYIGVFEILFEQEIPTVVAIDEAIELAKKFGNETSGRFVNGVLNAVLKNKSQLLEQYVPSA